MYDKIVVGSKFEHFAKKKKIRSYRFSDNTNFLRTFSILVSFSFYTVTTVANFMSCSKQTVNLAYQFTKRRQQINLCPCLAFSLLSESSLSGVKGNTIHDGEV